MIPNHVTIIMDGNGRWARKQGMERLLGHNAGADSVRDCCEYAVENGIKYLSLFAFSEENWSRPQEEIDGLMKLMIRSIIEEKPIFEKHSIRFRVIGDMSKVSDDVIQHIRKCEEETKNNTGLNLIIFMSYSGKWDILQAVNKYINSSTLIDKGLIPPITSTTLEMNLATYGVPEPDLMIRTSGEKRLSNYLLWQCAYTEFYFTDILWPDFRRKDFQLALDEYNNRERRFGKTGEQIDISKETK